MKEKPTRNQLEILIDLAAKQANIDKEKIAELTARVEELEARNARLVEAGDRMANADGFCCMPHNHYEVGVVVEDKHAPDCPVTQWLAAKEGG